MSQMTVKGSKMNVKLKATRGAPAHQVVHPGHAHFAMVEKTALANLVELMMEDMNAARIVVSLIRLMEPGGAGVVVISNKSLQELLGVSESTVARALRKLIAGKWVHRMRIGGAYAIAVNKSVAWVGSRGQMNHAVFGATVVASRAEQDEAGLCQDELRQIPMANIGEDVLPYGEEPMPPSQRIIPGAEAVASKKPFPQKSQEDIDAERVRIFQKEMEARGQQRLAD